jgi:hypothetical protein
LATLTGCTAAILLLRARGQSLREGEKGRNLPEAAKPHQGDCLFLCTFFKLVYVDGIYRLHHMAFLAFLTGILIPQGSPLGHRGRSCFPLLPQATRRAFSSDSPSLCLRENKGFWFRSRISRLHSPLSEVFGRHEPAKLFKYLNELVVLYRVTGRIVQTLCDGRRQHMFARVPGLDDFCFKTGNA